MTPPLALAFVPGAATARQDRDPAPATAALAEILDGFFRCAADGALLAAGDRLLVAFSGGPDSTALLAALAGWAPARGVALAAAHLDHGLDAGSAGRARAAAGLAAALGVACTVRRIAVAGRARPGESREAAARRVRYAFLEGERRRLGARWIATAHHRDDQAETVLLRLLDGSGAAGLAGIRARPAGGTEAAVDVSGAEPALAGFRRGPGRVVRPFLGVGRDELRRALAGTGLVPVNDPTNRDLAVPRNRVRHRLLPALGALRGGGRGLAARLGAVADAAAGAAAAVDRHLLDRLSPRRRPAGGVGVERAELAALPPPLLPAALALLHRLAGASYPPGRAARAELGRQLATAAVAGGAGGAVGCDCGDGWRWSGDGPLVVVSRRGRREAPAPFTYTLEAPGELEIPELSLRFRLVRGRFEGWMLRGERRRAGLALPLGPGDAVTVRGRRPGDRLRPLGAPGERRLKEVLIDRRVPRAERDRLPLLCLGEGGGRVAWVPGVTIDERFRLAPDAAEAWLAAIEPMESGRRGSRSPGDGTSRPATPYEPPEERGNRR